MPFDSFANKVDPYQAAPLGIPNFGNCDFDLLKLKYFVGPYFLYCKTDNFQI